MTLDRGIELAILFTLWVEFWYDAWWNGREQRQKRVARKRKAEHRYVKEMD